MITIISQMKLKIIERSTGNRKVEEWSFLPKDWKYQWRQVRIFQNLAGFTFNTLGNSIDDFLILNLVTRKQFWMRRAIIASELIEKAGRLVFGPHLNNQKTTSFFFKKRTEILFLVEVGPVTIWMIF